MKHKRNYDAATDKSADGTKTPKLKQPVQPWKKWTILATSVALIIGIAFIISLIGKSPETALLTVVFPKAYAFDDINAKHTVMNDNPIDEVFLNGLHRFSYETAAQIVPENSGNTNYSPLSLYYALAMAASGAKGATADELLALLGVSDQTTLSTQSGNLYRQLYTDNNIGKLKIANSLWMNKSINWEQGFIKNAAEHFYASSYSLDFSDKNTGQTMGKWVSDQTNGTLKPEFEINQDQILTLLNTVYFYDEWVDKFDQDKTEKDTFYLSDGTTVNADFMNKKLISSGFTKGEGFTRSSLGLKNANRMVFILPDEDVLPQELLSTPEKVKAAFEDGNSSNGEVIWQIPKFNFATKLLLVETLKSLGVNSAFGQSADFSGITNQPALITGIRQETNISIDEQGVEASAFTAISFAGAAPPQDSADMILNRPFIYGITAPNGILLFIGICDNPVGK